MNPQEADRQIAQMVEFIRQEAREKAEEIRVKTEQEFGIQRLELIENAKLQIREEFQHKQKDALMQKRIEKSGLINKSRLDLVEKRNQVVLEAKQEALEKLRDAPSHPKYPELLEALVVQGLIRLQEDIVMVRCREQDEGILKSLLPKAAQTFTDIMKRDTGLEKSTQLLLDPSKYLDARLCVGGVQLIAANGRIVLDNTLNQRLDLAFNELKPVIRRTMFPALDQSQ